MKKRKLPFAIGTGIGIVLTVAGLTMDSDYYSTLVFAWGVSLVFANIICLAKEIWRSMPKHYAEYEQWKKEEHIRARDERELLIQAKAGNITHLLTILILLALGVVLSLMHVQPWVSLVIYLLFLFQIVCRIICVKIFRER